MYRNFQIRAYQRCCLKTHLPVSCCRFPSAGVFHTGREDPVSRPSQLPDVRCCTSLLGFSMLFNTSWSLSYPTVYPGPNPRTVRAPDFFLEILIVSYLWANFFSISLLPSCYLNSYLSFDSLRK